MAIITELQEDFDPIAGLEIDPNLGIEEAEENFTNASEDVVMAMEGMKETLNLSAIVGSLRRDFESGRINENDFRSHVFCAESAVYGHEINQSRLVMANEGVSDRIKDSVTRMADSVTSAFRRNLDYLHQGLIYFSLLDKEVKKLQSQINSKSDQKLSVKIPINKYMQYGNNGEIVSDLSEYGKEFKAAMMLMNSFNRSLGSLAKEDLFSSFRIVKEALTGDPEEFFKERFEYVITGLTKIESAISAHRFKSTSTYDEYRSPLMLGLASVVLRLPKKNTYKFDDYESVYAASKLVYAYIDRKVKVQFSDAFSGSRDYEIGKRGVSDILKSAEEASVSVKHLNTYAALFSNAAGQNLSPAIFSDAREAGKDIKGPTAWSETLQFDARVISLLYDSISGAFNFTRGNIKQALRIAKAYEKKAS